MADKGIKKVDNVKLFCPHCQNEIISPRLELDDKIRTLQAKLRVLTDSLTQYKQLDNQTKQKMLEKRNEWLQNRENLLEELRKLKEKRNTLSKQEEYEVYFALKKAIVSLYGNQAYVDCMNLAMNMIEAKQTDELKKIEV